jgi:AcrR family transcriptional regulator
LLPRPASLPRARHPLDPPARVAGTADPPHPLKAAADRDKKEPQFSLFIFPSESNQLSFPSPLKWVRPAHQARSLETFQRLLDSAEELIAEKGFDDVPVVEIARRAGFSVGAVYARFRDKEGILRCLRDRLADDVEATVDAALDPSRWEAATVIEIAHETIAFMVQMHRDRVGILREILGRAHRDLEADARVEHVIRRVCEKLTALLLSRPAEIAHPEPALAVEFAFRLLLGVLKEAILFGRPGTHGIPSSDERLTQELTRAFLGYLGVRST